MSRATNADHRPCEAAPHSVGQRMRGLTTRREPALAAYASTIMSMPEMQEWIEAAKAEPADIEELEVEY